MTIIDLGKNGYEDDDEYFRERYMNAWPKNVFLPTNTWEPLTLPDIERAAKEMDAFIQKASGTAFLGADFAAPGSRDATGISIMRQAQANFDGVPVYVTDYLPETIRVQVRFPRSKRKRILKKWAKKASNWKDVPAPLAYLINSGLISRTFGVAAGELVVMNKAMREQLRHCGAVVLKNVGAK